MKLPFVNRKKHLQLQKELSEKTTAFEKLEVELSQLKNDLSLTEQQSVAEVEKLRQENKELEEKLQTAIIGNQEYDKLCKSLKEQVKIMKEQKHDWVIPASQIDSEKDKQIKNLKLKLEAKEKELEGQKEITFSKNQELIKLKNQ